MGVIVRQKVKGKGEPWWVFISYNGKRTSRKVGAKDAAQEVAKKIEARLQLGEFNFEEEKKESVPTFKEYADSWIKATVPATCKESSTKDYGDILRLHVLPVFGELKVTDITRGKIKNFLFAKINEGKAKSTVNHYRAVISGVLNEAVDAGVIVANPTHRLGRIGKKEDSNGEINPLTRDELKIFLDTVKTDEILSKHYPLILLLSRTGLRIGEALGLKWDDIDFNGRIIKVQRTYSKRRIGSPKNGKFRTVDISQQLADTLLELKKQKAPKIIVIDKGKRVELKEDKKEQPEWIFTNEIGNIIDVDKWRRRVFKKALEKAGLRDIRIHDLRHGYATLRLSKGDNIVDVANQLGDDVAIVLKTYTHWIPGKKKAEVDALDDPEYTQQEKQTYMEKQGNKG